MRASWVAFLSASLVSTAVLAQDEESGDLAQKLQNPVSDLISVPLQGNVDLGIGGTRENRVLLNLQPVVPFPVTSHWNVVMRVILPLLSVPSPGPGAERINGLGDATVSLFLSPSDSGQLIWGVGPAGLLPSATQTALGGGKLGLGPTGVILFQKQPWTAGVLANHLWSVDGVSSARTLNQTFVQPFVSYTRPSGMIFGVNSETLIGWTVPAAERWSIPINATVTKVTSVGRLPISLLVGGRYYVAAPPGGPSWGLRLALTPMVPTGK